MLKKVLVVEDESSIVTLLKFNLEKSGYNVIIANNGHTAVQLVREEKPDLMILDIMLPGMDGMDVCKTLRQEKHTIPILMLTAKDDEFDKVLGLELGADDYLTKPFSPREVMARVKAILRRSQLQEPTALESKNMDMKIGELTIYPEQFTAGIRGEMLDLTPKEFELLLYLAQHTGKVLNRNQLLDAVWNYDYTGDSRVVDVHISHLREKIETDTKQPVYIKTIRGFGYKLEKLPQL